MAEVIKRNVKQEIATSIGDTTIADSILNSFTKLVGQEAITCPAGYNFGNNLKLAYLRLSQKGDLAKATPASVGEALVDMVLQGLDVSKDQCYFITYGNKLTLFRSYFGDLASLEATGLIKPGTTKAIVVYEGDKLLMTIEDDEEVVKEFIPHEDPFARHDQPIKGAYAVTTLINGNKKYCFMSLKEIQASWNKSKDPSRNVQKDFAQEMAKRTVIRRLAKLITKGTKTLDGLTEQQKLALYAYNKNTEEQYKNDAIEVKENRTTITNSLEDFENIIENIEEEEIIENNQDLQGF